MATTHKELRERPASRFGRGFVANLFFVLAAIAWLLSVGGADLLAYALRGPSIAEHGVFAARILCGAATVVLLVPAGIIAQRHQRQLQVVRDQDIRVAGPVALYLRPFFIDKSL